MRNLILFLFLFTSFIMNSVDIEQIDKLNNLGKHDEALKILKSALDPTNPKPELLWRTARAIFEMSETLNKSLKKEKIDMYNDAMALLEPHLNIQNGSIPDRANIVFYYASNLGQKSKEIGIKESLGSIPDLKKYADKTLSIDPNYGSAYFLKAKIEEGVPSFLGGDKFMMGVYFSQAVKKSNNDLTILNDTADALYNRNWDSKKKIELSQKYGTDIDDFINKDDRNIAKELLTTGIEHFKTVKDPSIRDKAQYDNMLKLIKKF